MTIYEQMSQECTTIAQLYAWSHSYLNQCVIAHASGSIDCGQLELERFRLESAALAMRMDIMGEPVMPLTANHDPNVRTQWLDPSESDTEVAELQAVSDQEESIPDAPDTNS